MENFNFELEITAENEEDANSIADFYAVIAQEISPKELALVAEFTIQNPEMVAHILKQVRNTEKMKKFASSTLGKAVMGQFKWSDFNPFKKKTTT